MKFIYYKIKICKNDITSNGMWDIVGLLHSNNYSTNIY